MTLHSPRVYNIIMANPLETSIRYIGSVAGRTAGIEGLLREFHIELTATEGARNRAIINGLSVGLVPQISVPIAYEGFKRFAKMDTLPLIVTGGAIVDLLATIPAIIVLSHGHPAEAILAKLAANAATHMGLDLIDAGARGTNRLIKNFRPSATTLAV